MQLEPSTIGQIAELACITQPAGTQTGRCTRSGRAWLALFLFGLYIAIQAGKVPALDVVGFNGVATSLAVATQLAAGLLLCALGVAYLRWRGD